MEENFRFASAAVSDRGLSDKRPVNEDSFAELSNLGLFVVADGVGGAQAGDFASQMAVEVLSEAFANLGANVDAEVAMKHAIEQANSGIFNASNELPQLSSMATTIVALHISGNIATLGHVGDSRIYRIVPDGRLFRETNDHSVVEEEVRAGRMTPEQALTHPSRNVISRALGAEATVDVDLKTIMVEPGTMFLLCSDGITRHIPDEELAKMFHNEIEPDLLCEQMKDLCYKRGAEDNLTAVVVRVSSELVGTFDQMQTEAPISFEDRDMEEEETIAVARSPFESKIENEEDLTLTEERKVEDFSDLEEELDDEGYLLDEVTGESEQATGAYESSSVVVQASESAAASGPDTPVDAPFSYDVAETEERTSSGGAIRYIVFLLVGALLGAGGFYIWQSLQVTPEVPVLNESKSNNIPLTSFEEGRRLVDAAPDRYLLANAASPDSSEDHYLLGRAQLLQGKFVEAKNQFRLAKSLLGDVEAENAKTLAADIALGTAIVDNPAAQEAFTKELNAVPAPNANSAQPVNANGPVR